MPFHILAAVDVDRAGASVVARAFALAGAHDGRTTILHCAGSADRAVDDAAVRRRLAGDFGVDERVIVIDRSPHPASRAICAAAAQLEADVVVVGPSKSRPMLQQLVQGSTTVELLRQTERPVLIVRPRDWTSDGASAVVAVDVDKPLLPLIREARRVLGPVPMELLTVLDDTTRLNMLIANVDQDTVRAYDRDRLKVAYQALTAAASQVTEPGWGPQAHAAEGKPEEVIVARVRARGATVIVMQPEQKGWLVRALVGSLTEQVMDAANDCDLLVIPLRP